MNRVKLHRLMLTMLSACFGLFAAIVIWISTFPIADNTVFAQAYEQTQDVLVLPHSISCTSISVERLASFDGTFYEDGTGREVMNVAALEIYNNSNELIPYAYVIVYTEDSQYTFRATMIPPKASVLIPESQGRTLTQTQIVHIFGWTTVNQSMEPVAIDLTEQGKDAVIITNLSEETIPELTLFHRTYIPEGDIYSGGKAFETAVSSIAPGESVTVYPACYVSGYSHIVYYEKKIGHCSNLQ